MKGHSHKHPELGADRGKQDELVPEQVLHRVNKVWTGQLLQRKNWPAHPIRQGLLVCLSHAIQSLAQLVLLVPARVQMPRPACQQTSEQQLLDLVSVAPIC